MSVKFYSVCTTSAVGISLQHLNHPNLLVCSVYRFHVYFHVRLILHNLGIPLLHEADFSKVKNAYIKSTCYSTCSDGVDADETWMQGDWFYTTGYGNFCHEVKATKSLHQIILHDGSSHCLKVVLRFYKRGY